MSVKSLSSFYSRGRVWVKYGKILAVNQSGEQGKFKVKDKVYIIK